MQQLYVRPRPRSDCSTIGGPTGWGCSRIGSINGPSGGGLTMQPPDLLPVAIIGGGLGGAALALALQRRWVVSHDSSIHQVGHDS